MNAFISLQITSRVICTETKDSIDNLDDEYVSHYPIIITF